MAGEAQEDGYTIDELAALTAVPSRTIRFYQSKGALQPPQIRGRVAYYGAQHVARLKLIGELQDRGLRIKAIKDLVARVDGGELGLGEWLGLQDRLTSAWGDDHPQVLSQAEVEHLLSGTPPGVRAELMRTGLIEREGDTFLVRSPGLLQVILRLNAAGVAIDVASKSGEIVRKHVAKMTRELVDFFFQHAGHGFGRAPTTEDLEEAFVELRPMGLEALRLIFGREMQRVLQEQVQSGKTATMPTRSRRARKTE